MNGIHEVTGSIPVWSTNLPLAGVTPGSQRAAASRLERWRRTGTSAIAAHRSSGESGATSNDYPDVHGDSRDAVLAMRPALRR